MFDFDENYLYDVYTYQERYYFVAFNPQSIREKLLSQGADFTSIDNIYLSQAFFNDFTTAIKISDTQALIRINGVLVVVKQELCSDIDNEGELRDFAQDKLQAIKFLGLGNYTNANLLLPVILVSASLLLWLIFSLINTSITQSELLVKQESLKAKYSLPATSFQLKSMLKRFEKTDKEQNFIREVLHQLTLNKTKLGAKVLDVSAETKKIHVSLSSAIKSRRIVELTKSFKPYHFVMDRNKNGFEVRP